MLAHDIVATARAALGAPFRAQGRDPASGLDCVGLLVHVARVLKLPHHDIATYSLNADMSRLADELENAGLERLSPDAHQPGDILLFHLGPGHWHVGLASPVGVIHAHLGLRRVVEHQLDPEWRSALVAAYRFHFPEY